MRLPRDLSGKDLAARLTRLGYRITRQTGSALEHNIGLSERSSAFRTTRGTGARLKGMLDQLRRWIAQLEPRFGF